jgi:eukaryotic-like serine/threonine-protein kinase
MTIFARPTEWIRAEGELPAAAMQIDGHRQYFAFLSYSHRDQDVAQWLHDRLETFRVPRHLVGRITEHGPIPPRLTPIFRDTGELPASRDLGSEINAALEASRFLIVLCSPAAAESRWTNAEIAAFKRAHPDGSILAVIVDGEPFASDLPGSEQEECLPRALRFRSDRRGRPTGKKAEPLAADLRGSAEARRLGFLKLVAGMLGVGLDELIRREEIRRQRRLAVLASGSLAGMIITSALALTAIQARDAARDQREEAESLVEFMLGDLRAKLEPIGKLDALDAVGSQALAYYSKQDLADLSDEAIAQRSRALSLMGQIALTRGDLDGAFSRYEEALGGTAEMVRRSPDEPQRLFDHAQNVFYVGDIAVRRGRLGIAETALHEYKRLADRMVALDPDNRQWQMEVKYADTNLGFLLLKQMRYGDAARQFAGALALVERLAAADPRNEDYQKSVPETLAWLADAQFGEGRLDEAIAQRERQVSLLEALMRKNNDVELREGLIPARRALGRWLVSRGSDALGLEQSRRAVETAEELMPTEPDNMLWVEHSAGAKLDLAAILLSMGKIEEAAAETRSACDLSSRLLARDRNVVLWRTIEVLCLTRRTELAIAARSMSEARQLALRTVSASKEFRAGEEATTRFIRAFAYKLLGDVYKGQGNGAGAVKAWTAALSIWPRSVPETPRQLAVRAALLTSLGRSSDAAPLNRKLAEMGYRRMI